MNDGDSVREVVQPMTVAVRHDDLRRRSRAIVLEAVRREGSPSRTEIAARTGLSNSTISAISADLIGEGVLTEVKGSGAVALRRGRPQVALALDPGAGVVVTVVLLLDYLSVSIVDYAGETIAIEEVRFGSYDQSKDELVGRCIEMIARLLGKAGIGGRRVLRISFAVQGTTDAESRVMMWSPITPHTDIPFADRLEERFGVPVTVENDCNMMALALQWRDAGSYGGAFIAILLSHGIGMGMILNGHLFTGPQSSGGEFGHMVHQPDGALCRCGRRGCIEAYAGNYAIWRSAQGQPGDTPPNADLVDDDIRKLADAARDGDAAAIEAFRRAGRALGFGLGSLFALLDPAPVAFIGVGATAFDLIGPELRRALASTAGGQHSQAISFAVETDELPLIRLGCEVRALSFIDREVFAVGETRPGSRAYSSLIA